MQLGSGESISSLDNSHGQKHLQPVHNVVMVVIDASKELNSSSSSAIQWALNSLVKPGDSLLILGVLRQAHYPHLFKKALQLLGYRRKAELTSVEGTSRKALQKELSKKKDEIRRNIMLMHNSCVQNGVKLDIFVKSGLLRIIAVQEAVASGTTHVVLGSCVGKYYKIFREQLSCNVYQMKHNNVSDRLQVGTSLGSRSNEEALFEIDNCGPTLLLPEHGSLTCNSELSGGFSMEVKDISASPLEMLSNIYSNVEQEDHDIPEGKLPRCSLSPGLTAAFASFPTIMQQSSPSPPCVRLYKNGHSITRSTSAPSFFTFLEASDIISSATTKSSLGSMHLRRLSDAQFLNSLFYHNETDVNLLNFTDMHKDTVKHAIIPEGEMDSLVTVNATKRTESIEPFSNSKLIAAVSDHVLLQDCEQKPDQNSKILPPLRDWPKTPCRGMKPSRKLSFGPFHICSICNQRTPEFCRMPQRFTYEELESATDHFSHANFLAEGGFGPVYKGMLNGQFIAVKQHNMASSQGEEEFYAEMKLLSCVQHRNLVMLLGYCDEKNELMLVYEYVCNRSLDWHLQYNRKSLNWASRYKIALGAARALRYLHEECRVGCIVHRDMRPSNILLTHEFEPVIGDFGLARSQPTGDMLVETQVIGTFGYLAPEYAECGQISWRGDVYSFGVVLLELITGCKVIDLSREPGQQSLTEWARPVLNDQMYHELLDPSLELVDDNISSMVHAVSLCIRKDPLKRPRMSQVLHILENQHKEIKDSPEQLNVGKTRHILHHRNQSVPLPLSNDSNKTFQKANLGNKNKSAKLSYTEML